MIFTLWTPIPILGCLASARALQRQLGLAPRNTSLGFFKDATIFAQYWFPALSSWKNPPGAKLYREAPHLESHYLSLQLVHNSAPSHKKPKKPGKFVEFAGIALIPRIRRFFGVCLGFLLRNRRNRANSWNLQELL